MDRLLRCLITVVALGTGWANLPEPAAATDASALALILSTDKSLYLVAEPVEIRLRLENRGDEDLTGDFYLAYDLDRVRIQIAKGDGEFSPYVSKALEIGRRTKTLAEPVTISAGEAVEAIEFVSFDVKQGDVAFPAAGEYRLQALLLYDHYAEQLSSNIISLTVVDPTGMNREALDFLQTNNLEHLLTPEASLFPSDETAIHQLKVFLDSFAASTYVPYAQTAFDEICESSAAMDTVPDDCPVARFLRRGL